MEELKESKQTIVNIEFDIPIPEYNELLKYGRKIYTPEQAEIDIINYTVNHILKEMIERSKNKGENDERN